MATIVRDEFPEEYYAEFVRVDGVDGTIVLIFTSDNEAEDMVLAEKIAALLDGSG